MIALIDYAAGNLRSVKRALDFLEIENQITRNPKEVSKADAIIIPGVGNAKAAMRSLAENNLVEVLQREIPRKPFLGICLGLQILFEKSSEDDTTCLGILSGLVEKFPASEIKIPHIGWNPVDFPSTSSGQAVPPKILDGIKSGIPFYFVHSYVATPKNSAIVKATTTHGMTFPALIQQGNVWATQFHPEKSGQVGLQVLKNFADLL
ncbi:imidazole glycerol phosphate synthase subunit HisH [Candidatus Gracilibacteria bacterium]|nr:imidazole glycerol phosphate synthase subunit HisH [Candidatus Gracilibacteria bacterium]MCF7855992.1 imidazole glycerol phosphate synthase subunit HisH [Candidatus Gracilibacteria bacterium]MCF7896315.1 imidazole glycerol phosphate synthase subunit HisH [Candidatus Gracilibacteria bacterium]